MFRLTPPCHPERSGTTHQYSSAPTNHCRTANPAPSGAPAGGISIAKKHHITPRTTERSLSKGDKNSTVRPPSSGAGAPPSPSKGKAAAAVRNCLIQRRFEGKTAVGLRSRTKKFAQPKEAFPFEGEGGASAPDEGETGERTIERHAQSKKPSPSRGKVARQRRMRAKPANVQSNAPHHRCPAPAHSGFFPSAGVRRSFLYSLGEIPTSDRKAREKLLCPENPHFSATSSEV